MERVSSNAAIVARMLVSIVFLLNALGIIDQSIPAKEMGERGRPKRWFRCSCFWGEAWNWSPAWRWPSECCRVSRPWPFWHF